MITPQDKILYVANKLGLTSLKNMQASTGAIYDVDEDFSGNIFGNASRHQAPTVTNLTENQFEVNEALLIESIAFYCRNQTGGAIANFQQNYGSQNVILFDLIIGNKRVLKDTPVFAAGSPYTFANTGQRVTEGTAVTAFIPRNQIFMEGVGILIPPQVQFSIEYRVFNMVTGALATLAETAEIGAYIFGTKVLLNFNTTI